MGLEVNDLREHKQRLQKIIDNAKKELDAIELLIEGFELRGVATNLSATPVVSESDKRMTIKKWVTRFIYQSNGDQVTVKNILDNMILTGFKTPDLRKNLRTAVSSLLRELWRGGKLERINIGVDNKPTYAYKAKKAGSLF